MLPLDELKLLDSKIDDAADLSDLKPIYDRLAEIGRHNPSDFEVQVAVADTRQRVIDRGVQLRRGRGPMALDEPPPRPTRVVSLKGDEPPAPPPVKKKKDADARGWLGIIALVSIAWLAVFVALVQVARNRNMPAPGPTPPQASKAEPGTIPVDITTIPPGAAIQLNGETRCKSDCRLNLQPGNYQVTATLDGFDPGATGVTVAAGNPIVVRMTLTSQTQTVRLFTDLEGGNVVLDGKGVGELQEGQLVLDRVANGKHAVRVSGKNGDAAFAFEGDSGKMPVISGPVAVTNVMAVVVTSLGTRARVVSSSAAPVKVALNGQPKGEAAGEGLDIKDVPPGAQTLTVGEGKDERKLVVTFGPMPTVTAFLKSDVSTGTLVVSTGEDDVTVWVNGREYRRKTRRGELRVQTVGPAAVHVAKPGFQTEPEQRVEVKKGEEVKVAFRLKPLPKLASLQIRNGVPGTQIFIEDRAAGRIGPDGTLSAASLTPGEHAIEARRDGFITRRILRTLREGETLVLHGADIALQSATGSIHFVVWPPDAAITYRRADETQTHTAREATIRLEPGSYIFTAKAQNYLERSERATVVAGESRNVELALDRESRLPPPERPTRAASAVDWSGWTKQGNAYVRRGGNRVTVRSGPLNGTITFTANLRKGGGLFRGGKLRWFVEQGDGVSVFELDKKKFVSRGPDGTRSKQHAAEEEDRSYTIQVEVTPERIVHRMRVGDSWVTLDSQANHAVPDAKFGFVIPSSDEIAVSDLHYAPR
ncbi:MAG: PEGA domain-containing protein [Acidobacteria bacterium]|nr:PEGA domain-containing protein [Acidobacteriota bacterium]